MSCQYEKYMSYLKNFSSFNKASLNTSNQYNPYKKSLNNTYDDNDVYKDNHKSNDIAKLKEKINILTDLVISYKKELDEIKYMLNENKNFLKLNEEYKEENNEIIQNEDIEHIVENIEENNQQPQNKKKYIPLIFIPFLTYFLYKKYKL